MSKSLRLPNDHQPFIQWLAEELDADRTVTTGPRWRARLLKGRTVNELLAERAPYRKLTVSVPVDELSIISHHVLASGLSRHAWARRAIAHYLVTMCRVDRADLPTLARDLP